MAATKLSIFVLPSSGGSFPVQVGLLARFIEASETSFRPDVVLATSGGNVAAYMANSADWKRDRLVEYLKFVSAEMFLAPWSSFIPTWLFLLRQRSVFQPGFGMHNNSFSSIPNDSAAEAFPETWTGVTHVRSQQHRLFTNKRDAESTILFGGSGGAVGSIGIPPPSRPSPVSLFSFGKNIPPVFSAGDRMQICRSTLASASIPFIVQNVIIDGEEYCDGGALHASPVSQTSSEIYEAVLASNKAARLFYFHCDSLSGAASTSSAFKMVGPEVCAVLSSVRNMDINFFVGIIKRLGSTQEFPDVYVQLGLEGVKTVLSEMQNDVHHHYAVIVAAHNDFKPLNLSKLNGKDALLLANAAQKSIDLMVWKAEKQ
jgi:predicted acylesterase/phospholipase RssA